MSPAAVLLLFKGTALFCLKMIVLRTIKLLRMRFSQCQQTVKRHCEHYIACRQADVHFHRDAGMCFTQSCNDLQRLQAASGSTSRHRSAHRHHHTVCYSATCTVTAAVHYSSHVSRRCQEHGARAVNNCCGPACQAAGFTKGNLQLC